MADFTLIVCSGLKPSQLCRLHIYIYQGETQTRSHHSNKSSNKSVTKLVKPVGALSSRNVTPADLYIIGVANLGDTQGEACVEMITGVLRMPRAIRCR